MANFDTAYLPTAKSEGGYSDAKNDTGGETVFGLTRRDWPNWSGWNIVDDIKEQHGMPTAITIINAHAGLKDSVKQLFKANYWKPIQGDLINDQQIANQAFDTAINMGVGTASKFLQQCAGVTVDLHVGPKTIAAVNAIESRRFYSCFLAKRKEKYDNIIAANPTQAKFKNSWYSRLKPYV